MRIRTLIVMLTALVSALPAYAKKDFLRVTIAEAYIEMRTGPGRGFPVFHVADRGEEIEVIKRRTDWYQVRTVKEIEGWVHRDQLVRTLQPTGEPVVIKDAGWTDFENSRWEASVLLGDFDGASSISATGAYRLTPHLSAELLGAHISGEFSDGWMAALRLVHTPFPEWRIAPFFLLGTGVLHVSPRASLVTTEDRTDQIGQAGVGVRAWLTRRFMFRAEYNGHVAFTSRDENEEVDEWKAGFGFFF